MFTDNNPVAHLQTARLGAVEQRWVAQLSSFDYNIKYRSGKSKVNADALSRFPANPSSTDNSPDGELGMEMAPVSSAIELAPAGEEECAKGEWAEAQTADPVIDAVRRYVKTRTMPPRSGRQALSIRAQRLLQQYKKVKCQKNVLCRKIIDPCTYELCSQIVCPSFRSKEA